MKLLKITLLLLFSLNAHALAPEAHLSDESQEQRARELFLEVRCLVCEGQVIESSNTEFSLEMRKLIRQKIKDGQSDEEIKDDLVNEFGDDILTSARFGNNLLLWLLPLIFAVLAMIKVMSLIKNEKDQT